VLDAESRRLVENVAKEDDILNENITRQFRSLAVGSMARLTPLQILNRSKSGGRQIQTQMLYICCQPNHI
jgi:hypothetical protein